MREGPERSLGDETAVFAVEDYRRQVVYWQGLFEN